MATSSSSSFLRLPHRIWFLLPLVVLLLLSYAAALKSVGPSEPALNASLSPCERIQVSGYSRTKLGKYANSLRVNLVPIPEKLHIKIQVCVHRNATLGMCQCEKSNWKNFQKGIWSSSVISPYDKQYIDVKFSGSEYESSRSMVTVNVTEEFHQWRIFCLVAGLIVILLAPVVSSWLPFYYTSSMAVGVFLVVLIIIFQVMRLLPTGRKNVMYLAFYGSVVGAGSFILHQFSMMVNMILVNFGLSEDMYNPVAILVLVGIVITGAAFGFWTVRKFVVSKDGGVDASVAQFVKWAMRSVAATFILQSSLDTPMAMGAFVLASLLGFLVSKTKSFVAQSHWLVSAGERRPIMHGRAEFLSRPGGGGLWKSARRVPSYSGSPSYDVSSPSSVNRRTPIGNQDYYSTFHRTPNRKKMSKREYEELTQETTREAMAGLAASPGFSDWLIDHADRIKLLPTDSYDDELGSESDSTGEQSWTRFFW
ncbi:NEMP family [Arabidopsis thaliana x Arabidopsis arenosa]|uniref:NEMP family n=1 Tax=Arabidopsis thaliana x Arabidopsis arenosa TaxID=1240361 RepID=A0A8T2C5X8_9BRAS|nr:NEMP family [Arabidopsis thaliana x Arabidopsis arenosa]